MAIVIYGGRCFLLNIGSIVLVEYNGRHYECEVIRILLCSGHYFFIVAEIDDYLDGSNLVEVIR